HLIDFISPKAPAYRKDSKSIIQPKLPPGICPCCLEKRLTDRVADCHTAGSFRHPFPRFLKGEKDNIRLFGKELVGNARKSVLLMDKGGNLHFLRFHDDW